MNPTSPALPCILPSSKDPNKHKAHAGMTKREMFYMNQVAALATGLNPRALTDGNIDDPAYETLVKHADAITTAAFNHYEHGESITQAQLAAVRRENTEMRKELDELREIVNRIPTL